MLRVTPKNTAWCVDQTRPAFNLDANRLHFKIEENFKRHALYKKGETGGGGRLGLVVSTQTGKGDES